MSNRTRLTPPLSLRRNKNASPPWKVTGDQDEQKKPDRWKVEFNPKDGVTTRTETMPPVPRSCGSPHKSDRSLWTLEIVQQCGIGAQGALPGDRIICYSPVAFDLISMGRVKVISEHRNAF